jgi:peptidoglycan/LPS O-acetylase OafA/YrhL
MSPAFSVYLDLVRFVAACLVYVYHSNQRWLVGDVLPLSHYGHSAVIVFFVLSGFVIAWVTDVKENDWRNYFASRLSRVYSVVVPALVVCLLLDGLGRQLWAVPYGGYPFDKIPVRLGASLFMLNEPWFVSITSLSNVPFWSITYEFWYYVLFGMVCFLPRRWAWWAAGGLLLVLGPKIALLAPIWVAGVVLYRWQRLHLLPLGWAWVLVVGSTAMIIAGHVQGFFDALAEVFKHVVGPAWFNQFTFSKFFLGDYVLGLLVFCNFVGMRKVAPTLPGVFEAMAGPVKWLAGYTFTFYLLHQPLFLFWGAVLRGDPSSHLGWWLVTALTLGSVLVLGLVTEKRRPALRRALLRLFQRIRQPAWAARTDGG